MKDFFDYLNPAARGIEEEKEVVTAQKLTAVRAYRNCYGKHVDSKLYELADRYGITPQGIIALKAFVRSCVRTGPSAGMLDDQAIEAAASQLIRESRVPAAEEMLEMDAKDIRERWNGMINRYKVWKHEHPEKTAKKAKSKRSNPEC